MCESGADSVVDVEDVLGHPPEGEGLGKGMARISHISNRFVIGFGFSKGWAELTSCSHTRATPQPSSRFLHARNALLHAGTTPAAAEGITASSTDDQVPQKVR